MKFSARYYGYAEITANSQEEATAIAVQNKADCNVLVRRISDSTVAKKLAEKLLESEDPDTNLGLLAAEVVRVNSNLRVLEQTLREAPWQESQELALIHANRDQILKMHEEAWRRVSKLLRMGQPVVAQKVLYALNLFHPMHTDTWCGWPKESDDL